MRRILFLTICASFLSYGQIDSLLSYYPLQKGNMFQYRQQWSNYLGKSTAYYTVTMLGDTLCGNGKVYQQIVHTATNGPYEYIFPHYQRIDTATMQVFAYLGDENGPEYQIDSLLLVGASSAKFRGTRLTNKFYSTSVNPAAEKVLGGQWFCRLYITGEPLLKWWNYKIVKGLGLTTIKHSDESNDGMSIGNYSCSDTLIYARVNSKEYGTLLSVRDDRTTDIHFELQQNYPNPFNPSTTIAFSVPADARVSLLVFNVIGQEVGVLVNGVVSGGSVHEVRFDGSRLASGLYIARLESGGKTQLRKMLLMK